MIPKIVEKFFKKLPHFKNGRIDYSKAKEAAVLICLLKYKDRILLLKRSKKVRNYKGKWHGIGGYYDELKPLKEVVEKEIKEELRINPKSISSLKIGKVYKFKDRKINVTWIIYPVSVKLKSKPRIKLNWEHSEYKWIKPSELKNFQTVPSLNKALERVL